jgi:hypothetical protein
MAGKGDVDLDSGKNWVKGEPLAAAPCQDITPPASPGNPHPMARYESCCLKASRFMENDQEIKLPSDFIVPFGQYS